MSKPSAYLEDVTFDFEESEESLGAHIALTFDFQGGAASGYNKPLLFKADNMEVNNEMVLKLKELGVDTQELEKALFINDKFRILDNAIRDKKYVDWWDLTWLIDFDETTAIFLTDEGMYSVNYTLNGTSVTLDDVANPVVPLSDYVQTDGDLLISDSVRETVEVEVLALLTKSQERVDVKEKISELLTKHATGPEENSVIKSEETKSGGDTASGVIIKTNEEPQLDINEILKSEEAKALFKSMVDEAIQTEKAEKEDLKKSLSEAEARLVAVEKAEAERVEKTYTDLVKGFGFIEDEKVGELVKALVRDPEHSFVFVDALNKAFSEIEKVKAEFAEEKGVEVKTGAKDAISKVSDIAAAWAKK